jgi:hypothetical protein
MTFTGGSKVMKRICVHAGPTESGLISRCSGEYTFPDDDYKDDDRRVRLVLAPHLAAYLATVAIIVLISDLFL